MRSSPGFKVITPMSKPSRVASTAPEGSPARRLRTMSLGLALTLCGSHWTRMCGQRLKISGNQDVKVGGDSR